MTFEQWMEEMSKGTLAPRDDEARMVLTRRNDLIFEDLEEDESPRSV
jgi:hypothetical protein